MMFAESDLILLESESGGYHFHHHTVLLDKSKNQLQIVRFCLDFQACQIKKFVGVMLIFKLS